MVDYSTPTTKKLYYFESGEAECQGLNFARRYFLILKYIHKGFEEDFKPELFLVSTWQFGDIIKVYFQNILFIK